MSTEELATEQETLPIESLTKVLDCSSCNLFVVPQSIAGCTSLTELCLSNNKLSSISERILSLSTLRILRLDNNCINSLPKALNWPQLEELSLAHNRIKSIVSIMHLRRLKRLRLENNRIKTIPQEITTLKRLDTLNISNNSIFTLPEGIDTLQKLTKLNLSNNKLQDFPMEGKWTALKYLNAASNLFPSHIALSLKYFGDIRNVNVDVGTMVTSRMIEQETKPCRSSSFISEREVPDHKTINALISPRKKKTRSHRRSGSDSSEVPNFKTSSLGAIKKLGRSPSASTGPYPLPPSLDTESLRFCTEKSLVLSGSKEQLLSLLIFDYESCKYTYSSSGNL